MTKKKIAPPKDQDEIEDAANVIARGFCPRIYACKKCGWPVVDGYCCGTCGDSNPSEEVE